MPSGDKPVLERRLAQIELSMETLLETNKRLEERLLRLQDCVDRLSSEFARSQLRAQISPKNGD